MVQYLHGLMAVLEPKRLTDCKSLWNSMQCQPHSQRTSLELPGPPGKLFYKSIPLKLALPHNPGRRQVPPSPGSSTAVFWWGAQGRLSWPLVRGQKFRQSFCVSVVFRPAQTLANKYSTSNSGKSTQMFLYNFVN